MLTRGRSIPGTNVCIDDELGVVVLTSQEKWDWMKSICSFWLNQLNQGVNKLDYKRLLPGRGFMVYVTQAYPGMKPYLKGFNLSLETWRGGWDKEGWKLSPKELEREELERVEHECAANPNKAPCVMEDIKMALMTQVNTSGSKPRNGPAAGFTLAAPWFKEDLEVILFLAESKQPCMCRVQSRKTITVYYGFGDASSAGFGASVERPGGLHGRFGIWGRDAEDQSSNYRELRNLVETVE